MPRKTIEVSVRPAVLKWARESSGSTVEEAAERIGITAEAFARLEREESKLRLTQLRELAEYFKRPLAAFLLPAPPVEPKPPTDFRMLPGQRRPFERETRLAIRRAVWLRSVAHEISEGLGRGIAPLLQSAQLSDDPRQIAQRERKVLGINVGAQFAWKTEWWAYRAWRAAVEGKNILLFQLPFKNARGFSLSDGLPFAITVSSSDAVHGRIFTILHEYGHLLIRKPGVCLPGRESRARSSEASVERWCNQFAGELLVPRAEFLTTLRENLANNLESEIARALAASSRLFKVSEQVVLWRMLDLELISRSLFRGEMSRLQRIGNRPKRGGGGHFSASSKVLGENGRLFTSLVLEARGKNIVSYAEVADYLSLRLKYLPEIQSSLTTVAA